jgi:hypothetical protein
MTILEDLKSGRLVVVPSEALADLCNAVMADISEAKRRLDADIPKDAPVHPVSAFLTGTALHVGKARASPDHTAGLIALVEGMERERERDEARALLERCRTVLGNMARENEGAIFNRWPINHEPLRADARNLLPLIEKEIGCES